MGMPIFIETFDETVDPAETQCFANGVFVLDRLHAGVTLIEYEPHPGTRAMMLFQPAPPLLPAPNLQGGDFSRHSCC